MTDKTRAALKFRKKPVVVEAEQFNGWPAPSGVEFNEQMGAHIQTLEGPLHVSLGDWIITGVKGERYPCKPDIFAETYEAVE